MFKSQQRVPESVRKYSRMIKEAHKRLEHEKTIYSKQTTDKMTSKFIDFMQDIKKVPEEYIDKGTKK